VCRITKTETGNGSIHERGKRSGQTFHKGMTCSASPQGKNLRISSHGKNADIPFGGEFLKGSAEAGPKVKTASEEAPRKANRKRDTKKHLSGRRRRPKGRTMTRIEKTRKTHIFRNRRSRKGIIMEPKPGNMGKGQTLRSKSSPNRLVSRYNHHKVESGKISALGRLTKPGRGSDSGTDKEPACKKWLSLPKRSGRASVG